MSQFCTWPAIDHGLLSPSGRISKRARAAALERERVKLFGPAGLQRAPVPQPTERERLLREAKQCRDLAAGGMRPRAFIKQAERCEAAAALLT